MSDEMPRDTHVIRSSNGGGGLKWLLGAAVAAVLIGGGYFAWKNLAPTQPSTQVAYNAPAATEPSDATPFAQVGTAPAPAQEADSSPAASSQPQTAAAAPVQHRSTRRTAAAPAPVPEQVVGVSPVGATTQDIATGDPNEIVVNAPRRPVWSRTPSAYILSTLYPARALERGREGEASVHCTVRNSGALNCVNVSEYPANAGFGAAALRVARTFRHGPQRADGSSAAGSPVNLRVVFRMADDNRRG